MEQKDSFDGHFFGRLFIFSSSFQVVILLVSPFLNHTIQLNLYLNIIHTIVAIRTNVIFPTWNVMQYIFVRISTHSFGHNRTPFPCQTSTRNGYALFLIHVNLAFVHCWVQNVIEILQNALGIRWNIYYISIICIKDRIQDTKYFYSRHAIITVL